MKVKQLINILTNLPEESEVQFVYDGAARGNTDMCYMAKSGNVLLVDEHDISGYDEDQKI